MKQRIACLVVLTVLGLTGFSERASATDIYTICDNCSSSEKERRAKDVIAGNEDTIVYVGDVKTRTVTRHYVLVEDMWRGYRYIYRSSTVSSSSHIYQEYVKLWNVVDKLLDVQYAVVPAEIAWSPWDLLGDSAKRNEVLDWYYYRNASLFNSADFTDGLEYLAAGLLPRFLGSYSIKVYFADGGYIVLRSIGWTSSEQGFPIIVEFEIDLEASRDGVGNQIELISGDNAIIGSVNADGSFTSNGFTSNFILPGNWVFPNSSGGGGACTMYVSDGEVRIVCQRP